MQEKIMAAACALLSGIFLFEAVRTGKAGYFLQKADKGKEPIVYWAMVAIFIIFFIVSVLSAVISPDVVTAWMMHLLTGLLKKG